MTERAELEQAVAAHATRLGEKLRREGLATSHVTVFYHTSEHDRGEPMRSISTVVTLPEASNDTLALIPRRSTVWLARGATSPIRRGATRRPASSRPTSCRWRVRSGR